MSVEADVERLVALYAPSLDEETVDALIAEVRALSYEEWCALGLYAGHSGFSQSFTIRRLRYELEQKALV